MAERDQLKSIVSELYRTPAEAIGVDFPLQHPRLQGSAGRGVLVAAIRRRLGVYVAATFSARTYGELEFAVCGSNGAPVDPSGLSALRRIPEPASVPRGRVELASLAPVSIGVDIEMLDNLPEASDFWTSDFYRTHFTGPEIAYCSRQEHPRMHFAARWCAKEALAKCDARFRGIDPVTVQVTLEPDGQPVLEWLRAGGAERLPHALSLTHTPLLAAAVVAVAMPARAATG